MCGSRFHGGSRDSVMQFRIGPVPKSESPHDMSGWTPLREVGPILMQAIAAPVGIAVAAIVLALWIYATPVAKHSTSNIPLLTGWLIVLIPVHELLHAVIHPGFGLFRRSILGFWPSKLLFYAHYDGILSRNRVLAILIMPDRAIRIFRK